MTKKIITGLLTLIVLSGLVSLAYYGYAISVPVNRDAKPQPFVVEKGMGSTIISYKLKREGLIMSPFSFQLYTWTHGISSKLKDGDYIFSANMTLPEIAQALHKGKATQEISLTFIEGWNINEIDDYLVEKNVAKPGEFTDAVQRRSAWWDKYDILRLKPAELDLEGYLFPDTYRFYDNVTVEEIAEEMVSTLALKLTPEIRQEIARQGKTVHEVLTLASIVEKEVPHDADRKVVAGIFYARLDAGIGLQSDATVNYATGLKTTRPTYGDLATESLYNTYKYRGLPPGPIASPSLSAIEATLDPVDTDYLYFLTTPAGDPIYSKTYEEHLKAKAEHYGQ